MHVGFRSQLIAMMTAALLGCLVGGTPTAANVPPPEDPIDRKPPAPAPKVTSRVQVVQTQRDKYRIVIPRRLLKQSLKDLGQVAPSNEEQLGVGRPSPSTQRTLIAGLALSAGMCSLVLLRRKPAGTKILIVVLLGGATYFGSQWARADIAFPPVGPEVPTEIEIIVSPTAREVELYLARPKDAPAVGGRELEGGGAFPNRKPAPPTRSRPPENSPAPPR